MFNNSNGGYSLADLAAVTGGNNGWGFGGDGAWLIVLFLLFAFNGWGGMGFGGGFGGGMWPMMMGMGAGYGIDYLYPWLNNSEHISDGFRDQQLSTQISGLRSDITGGFADTALGIAGVNQNICQTGNGIQNALCQGFAGTAAAITGAQNTLSTQMYSNELASLNRSFAEQTANTQGFNSVQTQLAQCCCDNRAGLADLRYTVATEACADRSAVNDALRDVLAANNASTQRILDQLCQDKIDAKNDTIAQLRQELLYARGQASQDVQTARILAGQTNEVDALYTRLSNCPVPSTPVYGRTPIFTCNNNGCGCNGGGYYNGLVA